MHAAEMAVHEWLAGAHGDLPETQVHAFAHERGLHQIVVADRGATKRHQNFGTGRTRGPDTLLGGRIGVGCDTEVDYFCAGGLCVGGNGESVGGNDLIGAGFLPGRNELVACGQQGHAGAARDWQGPVVHGCSQCQFAGTETCPPGKQTVALRKIESRASDVAPGRFALEDCDRALGLCRVLLNDNGVGPHRDRGSCEDTHSFSGTHAPFEGMAGSARTDQAQRNRRGCHVGGMQGIAVHGRGGKGGLGPPRGQIGRKRAPARRGYGDCLGGERCRDSSNDPREGFGYGKEGGRCIHGDIIAQIGGQFKTGMAQRPCP